ncbi:MAG TPA: ferrous iron transport protein A [Firmicutes bacterium]|nr:ferrous iron transport protein A [Bacillota bacterium]
MEKCQILPLNQIPVGSQGEVAGLLGNGKVRRRLLDLGLIEGTKVEALQRSPAGDPTAYHVRGAVIALRAEEAARILVRTTNGIQPTQ